jgi:hypothetical protein
VCQDNVTTFLSENTSAILYWGSTKTESVCPQHLLFFNPHPKLCALESNAHISTAQLPFRISNHSTRTDMKKMYVPVDVHHIKCIVSKNTSTFVLITLSYTLHSSLCILTFKHHTSPFILHSSPLILQLAFFALHPSTFRLTVKVGV